jgi:hypothetical protein
MEPYLFYGVVLPERAQLTLQYAVEFSTAISGVKITVEVSILLNQVAVWVKSDYEWDIFDLRNTVTYIVQGHLALVGYLKGFVYDLEITRVLNLSRGIDYVYGIDIPCIAERNQPLDLKASLLRLQEKMVGPHGIFIHRCLNDLTSAMRNAEDTGFYCYRAIESLRHHCKTLYGLSDSKKEQWEKLQEVSGCDEATFRAIKTAADPLRHGEPSGATDAERITLFTSTWNIVDGYLNSI